MNNGGIDIGLSLVMGFATYAYIAFRFREAPGPSTKKGLEWKFVMAFWLALIVIATTFFAAWKFETTGYFSTIVLLTLAVQLAVWGLKLKCKAVTE